MQKVRKLEPFQTHLTLQFLIQEESAPVGEQAMKEEDARTPSASAEGS